MIYFEDELLPLSGLQHFSFCRRQWALIHLEGQWAENLRTTEGLLFHERAHDSRQRERRGDTLILRDLSVFSHTLGLSGKCDVVEFHADPEGIPLQGESGLWKPFPVEYKRGAPKEHNADQLQLCAQAICLEEMLCCTITEGALFYGETRRREPVLFGDQLRTHVSELCTQMHQLFRRGMTPPPTKARNCGACSLKELCLPKLRRAPSPSQYIKDHISEEGTQ